MFSRFNYVYFAIYGVVSSPSLFFPLLVLKVYSFFKNSSKVPKSELVFFSIFLVFYFLSIFRSLVEYGVFSDAVLLSAPFLLFMFPRKLLSFDFMSVFRGFMLIPVAIIFIFFLRIFSVEFNEMLLSGKFDNFGFFNFKRIFGIPVPVNYLANTLICSSLFIVAVHFRMHLSAILCFAALLLAPSRFGLVVLVLFLLKFLIVRRAGFRSRQGFFVFFSFFTLFCFFIALFDFGFIDEVRFGHVSSVVRYLSNDLSHMTFGMGPGSFFYSDGFRSFTNNIEVTPFEIFRRFGMIGLLFVAFRLFYFFNWQDPLIFDLVFFGFLLSFSNPYFLSIPFILLVNSVPSSDDTNRGDI